MQINSLHILRFRNIASLDLPLKPHLNVFYGENGEGKTSLLEAVHVLATGRSFRASKAGQIITFGAPSYIVSGVVSTREEGGAIGSSVRMGIERFQSGALKLRLADQDCPSIAQLAQLLPLQLINSDGYAILEDAPKVRRQFLDWAMFHVEPQFYPLWQRYNRALRQRNAALKAAKANPTLSNIKAWDSELVLCGQRLDELRQQVLTEFEPFFRELLSGLLGSGQPVTLQYLSGWSPGLTFKAALDKALDRDIAWGYTTAGPHRADLDIQIDGVPAKTVLSRGQSKLFVCALLMARAKLLYSRQGRHCVFLVDDLSSELDAKASQLLLKALLDLHCQILLTCIERGPLGSLVEKEHCNVFQVKKGVFFPEA